MDRRNFLALVASPVALSAVAALQSCSSESKVINGSGSQAPGSGSQSSTGVARSSKTRAVAALQDGAAATKSVNDFGVDLYKTLTRGTNNDYTNLVFSPASIALALDMTRAGAKGSTANEMDRVLYISDPGALAHSANALASALESRTRHIDRPQNDPVDITLAIANSLWAQKDLAFETAFLDLLATEYGAGLQLVDYKHEPEKARNLINTWVADKTKQRIPELIPQGQITDQSRLTLVNAIYMKAPWLNTFAKESTANQPFTTTGGNVVDTATMHLNTDLRYARGSGFQAVELPYIGEELSMLIVLPDKGTALADGVAAVSTVSALASSRTVTLSLPKFDIETATGLATVLAAMGMPTAFTNAADFTGMTTAEPLVIGAVIHQANITVDEEGTEAAAATAVVMGATSAPAPQDPVQLIVNRPFVFAIRDNPTGAVLFVGHIGDPTITRK